MNLRCGIVLVAACLLAAYPCRAAQRVPLVDPCLSAGQGIGLACRDGFLAMGRFFNNAGCAIGRGSARCFKWQARFINHTFADIQERGPTAAPAAPRR
ncbi:MAG: hypothetical protein NT045_00900 [Candidatus Aureabacteria bacterium]|nr:hypothetical protein [Candidatus Auribacterota bacterium]